MLEGFGVRLVPLSPDHVPALLYAQDVDTWKWMSESGATPELMAGFVERALAAADSGKAQVWATTVLRDGTPEIAGCSRLADLDLRNRTGEIGWTWVAPAYRGRGLNPRVKLLQLEHAFGKLHLRRVALKTHHGNARSQAAMLKLGAQYEGTFRNHMFMPDGSSRDTKWYSILDSEWPEVRTRLLARIAAEPISRMLETDRIRETD
jgi:RimJ/RimL family protein N-acetyltransferase